MDVNKLERIRQLLLKRATGDISREEQTELDSWTNESDENRKLSERLSRKSFLSSTILDNNKEKQQRAWNRLRREISKRNGLRPLSTRYQWVAAAAIVIILLGVGWLWMRHSAPSNTAGAQAHILYMNTRGYTLEGSAVKFTRMLNQRARRQLGRNDTITNYTEISVPAGGEFMIVLEDSTKLHVNSGSTLRIPNDFSAKNRSVYVEGEAYLDVHHDERHPFIVHTNRMEVKVTGTSFNVEDYKDLSRACVTLVDGRVEVKSADATASLLPGESAVIDGKNLDVRHADVYESTAWHNGRIVFVDKSLEDIMSRLGRWYNFSPVYVGERIKQMHMTIDIDRHGTFRQVAEMIEKTNGIRITINQNRVLLSEK